ncbi:MAG: hypothetical protein INQ03_21210 [Candidatus Heimdallarchaeota archaeon]|nr:hypothetical protein [Candidatus Heimdallarchaeota archaeon]
MVNVMRYPGVSRSKIVSYCFFRTIAKLISYIDPTTIRFKRIFMDIEPNIIFPRRSELIFYFLLNPS